MTVLDSEDRTEIDGLQTKATQNVYNISKNAADIQGIDNESFVNDIYQNFIETGAGIVLGVDDLRCDIVVTTAYVEGKRIQINATNDVVSFTANTSGSTRIDLLSISKESGVIITSGVPGSGLAPSTPVKSIPIFEITIPDGVTTDLSTSTISKDRRRYFSSGTFLPSTGRDGEYFRLTAIDGANQIGSYIWVTNAWVDTTIAPNNIDGSGSAGKIPKFQDSDTVVDSGLSDDGSGNITSTGTMKATDFIKGSTSVFEGYDGDKGQVLWNNVTDKPSTFTPSSHNHTGVYLPLSGGVLTGNINRSAHSNGFLEGSYNNIGLNHSKTNPIYTMGSNYNPTDTALVNMYGIGFTNCGSSYAGASFLSSFIDQGAWGLYLAADGDARLFLDASFGRVMGVGEARFGDGIANVPSHSFLSDTNTGMYLPSPDNLAFVTNGIKRGEFDSTGDFLPGVGNSYNCGVASRIWKGMYAENFFVEMGSDTSPSFSFRNDPDTGIYSPGADRLGFVTMGTKRFEIDATGHLIPNGPNLYDIGSTSLPTRAIYTNNLYIGHTASLNSFNGLYLGDQATNLFIGGTSGNVARAYFYGTSNGQSNAGDVYLTPAGHSNVFILDASNGYAGFGTTDPTEKVEVIGAIKVGVSATPTPADGTIEYDGGDLTVMKAGVQTSLTVGQAGQGVPTGGAASQILEKIDGTDFNTQWITPPYESDTTEKMEIDGAIKLGSSSSSNLADGVVQFKNGDLTVVKAGLEVSCTLSGINSVPSTDLDLSTIDAAVDVSGYLDINENYIVCPGGDDKVLIYDRIAGTWATVTVSSGTYQPRAVHIDGDFAWVWGANSMTTDGIDSDVIVKIDLNTATIDSSRNVNSGLYLHSGSILDYIGAENHRFAFDSTHILISMVYDRKFGYYQSELYKINKFTHTIEAWRNIAPSSSTNHTGLYSSIIKDGFVYSMLAFYGNTITAQHSKLCKLNLSDLTEVGSIILNTVDANIKSVFSMVLVGDYIYFANVSSNQGVNLITKFDTTATFNSSAFTTFSISSPENEVAWLADVYDGRYIWFSRREPIGTTVLKFDTITNVISTVLISDITGVTGSHSIKFSKIFEGRIFGMLTNNGANEAILFHFDPYLI